MVSEPRVWRGLRYATAPQRFAAPVIAVLESVSPAGGDFGAAPMQIAQPDVPLGASMAEDCHFLNVWSPAEEGERLPVVLWLYGGGFEGGAASMPQYDGAALARSVRCVVVTANYRVGTLGFGYLAHHGGMLAEAANLGLHDAAAALAWVVANIEAFGGDAEAITLAGQSAGGFLATALAVAPGAPRVRALAAFSGAASRIVAEDVARELGDALLMELGIRETPERIIDIPVERLLLAQSRIVSTDIGERNGLRMRALGVAADAGATRPVVPAHPMEVIRGGALVHAGILASATLDEAESFRAVSAVPADRDELVAEIGRMTDEHSARRRLADAYDDADLWAARRGLLSDYIYRMPAARTVEAQHDAGGRAWLLDITRVDGTAAEHSCELRALFGRSPETPAFELRDRKIARVFHELIRSGGLSGRERGAAIVAGDPVPPERTDPSELTELWRGVARP